jgi:hypothetical protein
MHQEYSLPVFYSDYQSGLVVLSSIGGLDDDADNRIIVWREGGKNLFRIIG